MFEPLRVCAPGFGADWPGIAGLQRLLDAGEPPVRNASGLPLRLVPPARRSAKFEERYEARVFLRGELVVRERNWHDLLNVLVWLVFPRTKAALNARHYAEEQARRLPDASRSARGNRGPAQDALTLFDEGGVIVVSDDDELLELLRAFRWKDLFWSRRVEARSRMRFVLFGHGLYEKALAPFTGITARGILLPAPGSLLAAQPARLLPTLDARVASWITVISGTRDLAPVPVLGVPGWCAENEQADYYDNMAYFRPGRLSDMRDE
jgi:hypothetical protein